MNWRPAWSRAGSKTARATQTLSRKTKQTVEFVDRKDENSCGCERGELNRGATWKGKEGGSGGLSKTGLSLLHCSWLRGDKRAASGLDKSIAIQ